MALAKLDTRFEFESTGRCSCGHQGKPIMTLDGEMQYMCVSCFLKEVKSTRILSGQNVAFTTSVSSGKNH
jgi:hypothetical protein